MKTQTPVTAQQAAARALGLSALVCRGSLETGVDEPKAEQMQALVLRWLDTSGARNGLENNEIAVLAAPLGTLEAAAKALSFWRLEELCVLAWALGKVPPPKAWERMAPRWVARKVGFLRQDADSIVASATVRAPAEIAMYAAYIDETREVLDVALRETPEDHGVQAAMCAAWERKRAVDWLIGERALELEAPLLG